MTEKRFTLKGLVEGVPNIVDRDKIIEQEDVIQLLNNQDERIQELLSCNNGLAQKQIRMLDKLIQLEKENEQLKHSYKKLKHRHSLLHDECLEAECDRDSLKKDVISLEKENEQLKQELESFEQVNFTDMCDGSSTVLYMKKEKVGDLND